jgi:hypothetical protein
LIDDFWAFVFGLFGAIGSGATAIALLFLWRQTRQTQFQMNVRLRPWIGVIDIKKDDTALKIEFALKNYGSVPGKIVNVRKIFSMYKIGQKKLRSSGQPESTKLMIFPDSIRTYVIPMPEQAPKFEYIGILLDYEYGEKNQGEYGLIAKYTTHNNTFQFDEIFSH